MNGTFTNSLNDDETNSSHKTASYSGEGLPTDISIRQTHTQWWKQN